MPGDLRLRGSVLIPESELRWRFSRSSGPGGQSVNTSDSRVELLFDVSATTALSSMLRDRALSRLGDRLIDGVLSVTASEQRSQYQNRLSAERKLVDIMLDAIAPPPRPRVPTRPTAGSKQRRIDDKKHRSTTKRLRRPDSD
ncbi:MAG: alternative ribosome rescue aminoacyl-tRNA hydrolase ArfB [Actinomycetes bacterium]